MTRLPVSLRYLAQFLAISFLCTGAQELAQQLMLRATGVPPLATLAGPVLCWLLIWGGRAIILHGEPLTGVTLILANLPLGRLVAALWHRGDEMAVVQAIVPGELLWLPVVAVVVLLLASPMVTAWRVLDHRRRSGLLAAFLLLPLGWDALLRQVWLRQLVAQYPEAIAGVPIVVLLAWSLAIIALVALRRPAEPRQMLIVTQSGKYAAATATNSGTWRVR